MYSKIFSRVFKIDIAKVRKKWGKRSCRRESMDWIVESRGRQQNGTNKGADEM